MPEAIYNNQVQPEDAMVLSERDESLVTLFADMLGTAERFAGEEHSAATMAASLRHDFAETIPNFEEILEAAQSRLTGDSDGVRAR